MYYYLINLLGGGYLKNEKNLILIGLAKCLIVFALEGVAGISLVVAILAGFLSARMFVECQILNGLLYDLAFFACLCICTFSEEYQDKLCGILDKNAKINHSIHLEG